KKFAEFQQVHVPYIGNDTNSNTFGHVAYNANTNMSLKTLCHVDYNLMIVLALKAPFLPHCEIPIQSATTIRPYHPKTKTHMLRSSDLHIESRRTRNLSTLH
ncbi:unnamed protein product, partial [Lactuca virosa]